MGSNHELFAAGAAGLLSHNLIFIHGEWHLQATRILKFYCLLFAIVLLLETRYNGLPFLQAVSASSRIFVVYVFSIFASMSVYRSLFHKLRRFPGPFFARLSKLWHLFHCLGSKNYILLEKLHDQYGDFVRTGPNELTIYDPNILPIILEDPNFSKPAWYDNLRPYAGLNTHRSKIVHEHRRRIWDHGFTTKALQSYEVQLKSYAHQLERLIAQSAGKPTNINQYIYWFSFDVMGQFAFSKPFDMLIGKKWHHAVQMLRAGLALVGPLSPTPWLVRLAVDFPVVSVVRDFQKMEAWCADQMDERIERTPEQPDVSHYLISWSKKHDRIEKDKNTLYGDAIALIVAGSDTAAHTLIYLLYHLARKREHLSKLQKELATIDSIENLRALQSLPYLNGLINETLRLHPPVPTGGLRETPAEGVWIAGHFVPGNTTICAPRYTLARLESCFTHANEFIPERWFSKPELIKNKNAFAPFALGRYYCIGKNLAYSELRYVTALLVSKYDLSLGPGETGARVVEDMVDQFTASPGQLELVFSERGE